MHLHYFLHTSAPLQTQSLHQHFCTTEHNFDEISGFANFAVFHSLKSAISRQYFHISLPELREPGTQGKSRMIAGGPVQEVHNLDVLRKFARSGTKTHRTRAEIRGRFFLWLGLALQRAAHLLIICSWVCLHPVSKSPGDYDFAENHESRFSHLI